MPIIKIKKEITIHEVLLLSIDRCLNEIKEINIQIENINNDEIDFNKLHELNKRLDSFYKLLGKITYKQFRNIVN